MEKELKIRVVFDTGRAKAEVADYAEGSIGALEKNLRNAKLAMKDLTVGTEQHTAALVKLKILQTEVADAYGRGISAIKNTTGASANAAVTLQALNYTIRDSPYFARDFALGMLAIGNNLNPLIDGLIRMNKEAKEGQNVFSMLAASMKGSAGVIFFFSVLVSVIQAVTFAMAKSKSAAKEQEKSLSDLAKELKNLEEKLRDARDEMMNIPAEDSAASFRVITKAVEEQTKALDELIKKEQFYKQVQRGQESGGTTFADQAYAASQVASAKEGQKIAEEQLKIEKEKQQVLLKQDETLLKIKNAYFSGDKGLVASIFGGLSEQEQSKLSKFIKDNGATLDATAKKSFQYNLEWIELTKERAKELGDMFDKVMKPPKDKKDKELDVTKYGRERLDEFQKERDEILRKYNDAVKDINETSASQLEKEKAINLAISDRDILLKKLANKRDEDNKKAMADWIDESDKALQKKADEEQKWNDIIAKHAAKTIHDELQSKIASIRAEYQKLLNDLDKSKLTPESKAQKKTQLQTDEIGEIKEAKLDAAIKKIKADMSDIKHIAMSIGDDLYNAAIQGEEGINSLIKSIPILIGKLLLRLAIEQIIKSEQDRQIEAVTAQIGAETILVTQSGIVAGEMAVIAGSMGAQAAAMTTAAAAMTAAAIAMAAAQTMAGIPFLPFATGGIVPRAEYGYVVPGQSYSGDKVPILANSGEMILNLQQQTNLLRLLSTPINYGQTANTKSIQAMNMNMASNQPIFLIQTEIDGLKLTKKIINPAQAKLLKGNVVNVS